MCANCRNGDYWANLNGQASSLHTSRQFVSFWLLLDTGGDMQYFACGIDKKTKNHVNIARFTPVLHIDTQHGDGPSIPENERN